MESEYNELAGKHGLPSFEEMDRLLLLSDFSSQNGYVPKYLLKFIKNRFADMFSGWLNFLHGFIFPNPQSAILMSEYSKISEQDKSTINTIIKEMMIFQRESTIIDLDDTPELNADIIKRYFKFWKDNVRTLQGICGNSLENWKKEEKEKQSNIAF